MGKKKLLLSGIFVLIFLQVVFANIEVNVLGTSDSGSNQDRHSFIVNKYFYSQPTIIYEEKEHLSMIIEPIDIEKTIDACSKTNLSFKLSNPTKKDQIFNLGVVNFIGTVYLSKTVLIPSLQTRLIQYSLVPSCSEQGDLNPIIVVETDSQIAKLPILLHVNPKEIITKEQCSFYYNQTICSSDKYLRFYQATTYKLDVSELFYDPDGDKLKYDAQALNLVIKFKNEEAFLKPRWDWYGTEEVIFTAEDEKGGKAFSTKFYVHVLPNNRTSFENFVIGNMQLLMIILIVLVVLFLLVLILASRNKKSESTEQDFDYKDKKSNKK